MIRGHVGADVLNLVVEIKWLLDQHDAILAVGILRLLLDTFLASTILRLGIAEVGLAPLDGLDDQLQ